VGLSAQVLHAFWSAHGALLAALSRLEGQEALLRALEGRVARERGLCQRRIIRGLERQVRHLRQELRRREREELALRRRGASREVEKECLLRLSDGIAVLLERSSAVASLLQKLEPRAEAAPGPTGGGKEPRNATPIGSPTAIEAGTAQPNAIDDAVTISGRSQEGRLTHVENARCMPMLDIPAPGSPRTCPAPPKLEREADPPPSSLSPGYTATSQSSDILHILHMLPTGSTAPVDAWMTERFQILPRSRETQSAVDAVLSSGAHLSAGEAIPLQRRGERQAIPSFAEGLIPGASWPGPRAVPDEFR